MASRYKAGAPIRFVQNVNGKDVERVGRVWSDGPVVSSVWVQPVDDERNPVPVKLPTQRQADMGQLPKAFTHNTPAQAEVTRRRCSNVSRRGQVVGVVDPDLLGNETSYHADLKCPLAAGKPQRLKFGRPDTVPAYLIMDVLTGKTTTDLVLCRRCVWLDDPGEVQR